MSSTEQTTILEFPITTGQNEGTERSVLPVGEFSALVNARFRKSHLLGKRNGYTSKSSTYGAGTPLGNGEGLLSCLGPEFCVVDDRFYRRDTTSDVWARPPAATGAQARTLSGRFPEFMPAPVLETTTQQSITAASDAEGSMTYALGYVWTAEARALSASGWVVHVDALDPMTGDVVFGTEIELAAAANTDEPHVQLLTTQGGSLVLVADRFTAGTKSAVTWYVLTSLTTGFGAAVNFTCIESAVNYATDPARPNAVLFACTLTATPAVVSVGYLDVTTAAFTSTSYAVGGAKTLLSVFQAPSAGLIRLGFREATGPTVVAATFTSAPLLVSAAAISTLIGGARAPVMFAERSSGTVLALTADSGATAYLNAVDVDATGSLDLTSTLFQVNCEALSLPFSVDGRLFIWVRYAAGIGIAVASLLRIPDADEYTSGVTLPGVWPIQATLDDRDVAEPLPTRTAGPVVSLPQATPLGYAAFINYTRETYVASGGITFRHRAYALVPVRHRSEGVRYAASCVVPCSGRQFVACAQPMWVDRISAYEAGFIQAPVNVSATPGGGGSLTAGATYSWTCIFQSSDGSNIERSGPAIPVTVAMGADTKVTLVWTTMELGSRREVAARVYRTLANGSVWQFVGEAEAAPGSTATGQFTFIDTTADSDVSQNEALYVNIGQEQPASNFPACSFANVGGGRLWVGGGFTGNIGQASKRFTPRILPEFVDDDAWRIPLPETCTGSAWLDSQVWFTQNSIHVTSGEGPDEAGDGFFTTSELPFNIGCVDWRSVAACDLGIFFQTARGLYLLPRGFGQPIAMDQVLDTLTAYPIITAARSNYNSSGGADNSEQLVQWCAVTDEEATEGVVITFDVAYKCFYVDEFEADFPATFLSGWSGEAVQAPALTTVGPNGASRWHPFRVRDASYDDEGLPISMYAETGDIRPWGIFGHGVVERSGILAKLRSACTVNVTKTTDKGSQSPSRVYDGTTPPTGDTIYLASEQGSVDQRDVTSLRLRVLESSTSEGVALIGMVIETSNQKQNFKLLSTTDRLV